MLAGNADRRLSHVHIEIVPLLPEHGRRVTRWPVLVIVEGDDRDHGLITPRLEATHARVNSIEPSNAVLKAGGRVTFFVRVELAGVALRAALAVSLPALDVAEVETELPLGIDLCELGWESWRQGEQVTLQEVTAIPAEGAGPWRPIHMPAGWQEGGVTWVRTHWTIPESWNGEELRFSMRSVSQADAAFLNGVEIGRTTERDAPRDYAFPRELVRWDQENELYVAVENPQRPTTVPQFRGVGGIRGTPVQIIAGKLPESCHLQAGHVSQVEAARFSQDPIGAPQPMRKMVVRDGVLHYADGGEVALWGENIYPQSWAEYKSLVALGINPRRAVDDDLDDFVASGIEVIRIHVFDSEITDIKGNLIHNDHLDVLDYLVAGCSQRGIYLWLTPIAWWGSPQARPDALAQHTTKQAMSMWPVVWQAEARYLRQFLRHSNPYTGRRLMDEPCLVLLEIMNEPWYWSYPEVLGLDRTFPGEIGIPEEELWRCLAGVRRAFRRYVPSAAWLTPQVFLYWRYDTLRRYINAMVGAIRSAGADQPVACSAFHSGYPRTDIEQALADSDCDALTTWAYPGGLEIEPVNDGVNILPGAANTSLDARLASKARLVYEFDAAGVAESCYMYPAMARRWRNIGVQVACQFQYDCKPLAHLNWAWETHYLNLWHTPGKWVSYMIAGEVFRRLPRGATFDTPADDQVFGPAAVSFRRNTALLCAEDCYMQARPTPWRPLPLPVSPRRIVTVGSCPYYEYDGTGIVMLQAEGEVAALRIYPDVERLKHALRGTPEEPLTRLHEAEHPFRLRLKGWEEATVQRYEDDDWVAVAGAAGDFVARAGAYRLTKQGTDGSHA